MGDLGHAQIAALHVGGKDRALKELAAAFVQLLGVGAVQINQSLQAAQLMLQPALRERRLILPTEIACWASLAHADCRPFP